MAACHPLPWLAQLWARSYTAPLYCAFDAALVAASDPWASSVLAPFLGACGAWGGVDCAGTGMGWAAAAAVAGFVLTPHLSELGSLAAVSGEEARRKLPLRPPLQ